MCTGVGHPRRAARAARAACSAAPAAMRGTRVDRAIASCQPGKTLRILGVHHQRKPEPRQLGIASRRSASSRAGTRPRRTETRKHLNARTPAACERLDARHVPGTTPPMILDVDGSAAAASRLALERGDGGGRAESS